LNKKILKSALISLLLFIFINLLIFLTVCAKQTQGKVNIPAKIYLSGASTINFIYIIPISKVFGWDNLLVQPFYLVRNSLYNKGISLLPKDDGEKYSWWFAIKFSEFQQLVDPQIEKFTLQNEIMPDKKVIKMISWTNELNQQIEPFAKSKIADKHLRERRLNHVNALIYAYLNTRIILVDQNEQNKTGRKNLTENSDFEINRHKKLVNLYKDLKDYSKKYEKESYDYFFYKTRRTMYDPLINLELTKVILRSEIIKNKFNCEDPYLKIYGEAYTKLETDYRNRTDLSTLDSDNLVWATGWSFWEDKMVKKCPNLKELKDVKKNVLKDYKNIESINEKELDKEINKWRW